ncbi:hypothetical protein FUA26_06615 [Seonamhaeicola algicola]|uniref:Uncharacterized protein n=1 Tax=Seonamhaeicola algicola TaxID=1719036 RepID=A0A5C7ASK8_9FLAO|nr:hypothetical protein [Seonamhaeicola algicola]TXE11736.1 hypothetical protein FUA26_06615 [Seonamhaeicola algicola]
MEEFLLKNYIIITHSVEAIAALTGVFLFSKYKHLTIKYFIFFLIALTICDILNWYPLLVRSKTFLSFLKGTLLEKSYWWSTLFWNIGAIIFFAFYYNKILTNKKFKSILKYSTILFLLFSVSYILFNFKAFFKQYLPWISILGAIIVFLCSVFYFIETLLSDRILTFYKSMNFYISAAIFIWWLIITPIVFFDIYMSHRDMVYIGIRRLIYILSNIIMYSTFTFALIFCKPEDKTTEV